ncbi:MAG: hypothetical protein IJ563_09970 [Selenomonadaceae bacterium]|nr:hypothetical protein [Selenomonadaceae bacterium]
MKCCISTMAMALMLLSPHTIEAASQIPNDAREFQGHYYYVFDNSSTWHDAQQYCERMGGHLAAINSGAEQSFIESLIYYGKKNAYWLGGYKQNDGNWYWITNESFNYTHWAASEPNNFFGNENRLMMYRNNNPRAKSGLGYWNDIDAEGISNHEDFFGAHNFGFICEWDSGRNNNPNYNNGYNNDYNNGHHHRGPNNDYGHYGQNYPNGQNDYNSLNGGNVISMLHFNNSAIRDEAGNSWSSYGTPAVVNVDFNFAPVLQLDGRSYLQMDNGITLGGRDFTIDGWAFISSNSGSYARIFEFNTAVQSNKRLILSRYGTSNNIDFNVNTTNKIISGYIDRIFHFAYVYEHNKGLVSLYINGQLQATINANLPINKYNIAYIGKSSWNRDGLFNGYIDEFRVVDGAALWTSNFNPPTHYSDNNNGYNQNRGSYGSNSGYNNHDYGRNRYGY